jgi:transmembrane sensor
MSEPRHSPSSPDDAELEASRWIVRIDAGLSAEEQDALSEWLAADGRHRELLAVQKAKWKALDRLENWRPVYSAEPNPDLLARPRRRPSRTAMWLGGVAAGLALALALWRLPAPAVLDTSPVATEAVEVAAYESRELEDGSRVELNRGARFRVVYTADERHVYLLSGEAFFEVAKDAARPFVVHAGGMGVRAIGTAFNVRVEPSAVDVFVTGGRVQVQPAHSAPSPRAQGAAPGAMLEAGERVQVARGAQVDRMEVVKVTAEEADRLLAWKPRLLEFSATPLAEVVAEFNRRNRVRLVLGDPALEQLPIEASFRSDNVEGFVRVLELTAGVKARRAGEVIHLERAR